MALSRGAWNKIKQSNLFYVRTFRWIESALVYSVALSVILSMAVYHVYFSRNAPDFYATSGVTEPVQLTSMNEPNYSSYPLLANEQNTDDNTRSTLQ